jgi:hypothetical protein
MYLGSTAVHPDISEFALSLLSCFSLSGLQNRIGEISQMLKDLKRSLENFLCRQTILPQVQVARCSVFL